MAIVAGIDEAGFGPLIGPLVVSVSVFRVPDASAEECMWRLLSGAVTRKSLRTSPALPLADSKSLRVRSDGVIHLERGVLGALAQTGPPCRSLRDLLRRVAPRTLDEMQGYPWYADADLPLPRQAHAGDLVLRANGLTEALRRRRIELESVRAEPVLTGDYNRLVRATRNKAVALFGVVSRLIMYAFNGSTKPAATRILVDRQGGRLRYVPHLQRMFDAPRIRVIEESPRRSAYFVESSGRSAEIAFHTKGDNAFLPVALGSMVSKYIRELFMELLNAWWQQRSGVVKPTAGYYVDGKRFLKEIAQAIKAERIDTSLLVRCR